MERLKMGLSKVGMRAKFRASSRVQRIPLFQLIWEGCLRLSAFNNSRAVFPTFRALAVSTLNKGYLEARKRDHSPLGIRTHNAEHPRPLGSLLRPQFATINGRIPVASNRGYHTHITSEFAAPPSSSSFANSAIQPPTIEPAQVPEDASVDIMVIGSMAVELNCMVPTVSRTSMLQRTSHPSKMHASASGVANNLALATSYSSSSSVRLITSIGSDPEGAWLREHVQNVGLDVIFISGEAETARQVAIYDKDGELAFASADMSIIEGLKEADIRREIRRGKPKFLAFDGYVSPTLVKTILEECGTETRVLFEPTSVARAATIFQKPAQLGLFPKHSIDMITPNVFELKAMFNEAERNNHFEGEEWVSLIDSFGLTTQFRQDVEFLLRKVSRKHRHGSLDDPIELEYNVESQVPEDGLELKLGRDLMGEGAFQQAVALLPYIPNIFIKIGSLGIFCVRLCPKDTEIKHTDAATLRFPGVHADIVVQHHRGLPQKGIVNVTGAGDTLSGVLLAKLAEGRTIDEAVDMAQKAAVMTLASPRAVSEQIRQLKV